MKSGHICAVLFILWLISTGNADSSGPLKIRLTTRPALSSPSQIACNILSLILLPTSQEIYLMEMSSSIIYTVFPKPKEENKGCMYQEMNTNSTRTITIFAKENSLSVLIFLENKKYSLENGNLIAALQSVAVEPIDVNPSNGGPGMSCGVVKTSKSTQMSFQPKSSEALLNFVNNTIASFYVELYLVADNDFYKRHGNNTENIMYQIVNNVNAMYRPEGIHILLVGAEIWKTGNKMNFSSDPMETLENFKKYRATLNTKHDSIHLLTSKTFNDRILGMAYTPGMCSQLFSTAISSDNGSLSLAAISTAVTHEMGHTFGMVHDDANCTCLPDASCIMNITASISMSQKWSTCSRNTLQTNLRMIQQFKCLQDIPDQSTLLNSNLCGNGVIDGEEDCDPGMLSSTSSNCCDQTTCKFRTGATCASGRCCDKTTCRPMSSGTTCRLSTNECDLPEYCDGLMEHCPDDRTKANGQPCDTDGGFCYDGQCSSHNRQCKLLMGGNSTSSTDDCYNIRNVNTSMGYCSYVSGSSPIKSTACTAANVKCGQLQCTSHETDRADWFTMTPMNLAGEVCNSGTFDAKLSAIRDPLLVPNGAKCGTGKWCVDSVCQNIPTNNCNCTNNGVCNDLGNCHCNNGFYGLDCSLTGGCGGSIDSGPACLNPPTISTCPPNYCKNGGTCVLNTNGLQCLIGAPFCCRCPGDYLEPRCDSQAVKTAQVIIKSNITFMDDFQNTTSTQSKEFEKAACQLIRLSFRRTFGLTPFNCQLSSIRRGSAIGIATVKGNSDLSNSSVNIVKALTQFCALYDNPSNLTCSNQYLNAPTALSSLDPCYSNNCSTNANCIVVSSNSYTCVCRQGFTDSSSSSLLPGRECNATPPYNGMSTTNIIIIVVVVVGGSLIILIIIIVILLVRKKKRTKSKVQPNSEVAAKNDVHVESKVVLVAVPAGQYEANKAPAAVKQPKPGNVAPISTKPPEATLPAKAAPVKDPLKQGKKIEQDNESRSSDSSSSSSEM